MTDDRDPLDDALARGLGALAPTEFELDADQALGSMRPAFQRARSRRRMAVATSALGVLVVVLAGTAVVRDQSSDRVNIRGRSHPTVPTVSSPRRATTTTSRAVTTTTAVSRATTSTSPDASPSTTTVPAFTATTIPGAPATSTSSTTATTLPAPATKTYSALGGHATIRFAGGRLTLVSSAAAAGYTRDLRKNTADEIEIRFSNGQNESRIRVRVQDGGLRPEVTEN